VTGLGVYPDGMVEHDGHVGQLLDKLDELGIADNTIVMHSTDNGAEVFTWPDGGRTPFYGEKNSSWEGGYRVPLVVRWPGLIEPGSRSNAIISHQDWLPTLVAAVGDPDVKEDLLDGMEANGNTYTVHLDGYNFLPVMKGEVEEPPRKEFIYFTDGGSVAALRYKRFKILFLETQAHGFKVWSEPFVPLRWPRLFDLRADPFERAYHEGIGWTKWAVDRMFVLAPAQTYVREFLMTFKDFPPRQKPGSFSLDNVLEEMQQTQPN
jgi:arylsulfatase